MTTNPDTADQDPEVIAAADSKSKLDADAAQAAAQIAAQA